MGRECPNQRFSSRLFNSLLTSSAAVEGLLHCFRHLVLRKPPPFIRLETRRNGRVALVSLAGLAKAARVRHLGMQRGGGRRDPKLSGYMRSGMAHVQCK